MIAQRQCKKERRKEGAKPGSNYSDGDLHSLKAKIPNHREEGKSTVHLHVHIIFPQGLITSCSRNVT